MTQLDRPYFRVARPVGAPNSSYIKYISDASYVCDPGYASDRTSLIRSYHTLEDDLLRLFQYVEPCRLNRRTHSLRLYELLLRAATEFEANCKAILVANSYPSNSWLTVKDYRKLNLHLKLSEYQVMFLPWSPSPMTLMPLSEWSSTHILDWYDKYNKVKHDRSAYFRYASVENVVSAVASVFIMLYSQFGFLSFSEREQVSMLHVENEFESHPDSVFSIRRPCSWTQNECYDFDDESYRAFGTKFNSLVF